MRINNNLMAMNTHRQLGLGNAAGAKSMEKLASGFRINRAGDDAAGLAISEKMRGQIRGLNQGSRNAQDGISMIQTAEGALQEAHSIMQRMRELAVQASNDTNTSDDRAEIQKEVNQMTSEINRIGNNTEFNTQKLLNGGLSSSGGTGASGVTSVATQAAADATQASYTLTVTDATIAENDTFQWDTTTITVMDAIDGEKQVATASMATEAGAAAALVGAFNEDATFSSEWVATDNGDGSFTITARAGAAGSDGEAGNSESLTVTTAGAGDITTNQDVTATNADEQINTITFTDAGLAEGLTVAIGDTSVGFWDSTAGTYANADEAAVALGVDSVYNISNANYDTAAEVVAHIAANVTPTDVTLADAGSGVLTITADNAGIAGSDEAAVTVTGAGTAAGASGGVTLQIGANASQTFSAAFEDMRSVAIDVSSTTSADTITTSDGETATFTTTATVDNNGTTNEYALDVSSATNATAAISAIDDAIKAISEERSKLGAYQNRLEHTIKNLDASSENLQAAESRVRDVDMAKEMMEFTKNNILQQAAQAMLAQANTQPQGVLQLLR